VLDNRTPLPQKKKGQRSPGIAGGEVYRSADKGTTWKKMNIEPIYAGINYAFGDIRVSPENEDIIYVLGVNVMRSRDGGKTYEKLGGTVVHLLHHSTRALHLDHHDLWIDPLNPERLLLGNDGGLYITSDRGNNWLHVNNLPIAEFYAVNIDSDTPYNIYGGTQDNAAVYGPGDQAQEDGIEDPWKSVWIDIWGGGDSFFTLVDPTDPNIIYYEHQFGQLKRKNMKTGETFFIQPRAKKGEPNLRYNWMTPYIISVHNPLTLYYGANKLFKSLDRGDRWKCISPDLSTNPGPDKQGDVPYGAITTISESPLEPGLLFVGTDDGNVHFTRNDGITWKKINNGLPDKWVSRVVASSYEPGIVYVSLTGYRDDDFQTYLYRSSDFGTTWHSLEGNLPAQSINVIRENPHKKNILYTGTDQGGVYVSLDTGKSWQSLCCDLPTIPVHDIAVHQRDNELVIGTHGRGAFVLDTTLVQEFDSSVAEKEAHLFTIRPAVLPKSRDYRGDWALETGKTAVIHYYLKEASDVKISIFRKSGKVLREIKGTGDAGINRAEWDLFQKPKEKVNTVYEPGRNMAAPGDYKVRIEAGSTILEGVITVKSSAE
jgi:photosystem II stability/assembly factor-like uncharacterized protein